MVDPEVIKKEIEKTLQKDEGRKALSLRFPLLAPLILRAHYVRKKIKNRKLRLAKTKSKILLPHVTARHTSPLRRKLGTSDMRLQEQKIINLRRALADLNGLCIQKGETFSLWEVLGEPTEKRGYVDGMLLSQGRVVEGLGGGLCQLANLLHFLFLHTPLVVTERYHHSMDVFPDSGRTIPFASGATIMYNFIDLQITNNTEHTFQLKLWLTDSQLKGHVLSDTLLPEKFHVYEKEHLFARYKNTWYRRNQLWRESLINGEVVKDEYVYTSVAPVLYEVTDEYLEKNQYTSIII